MAFGQCCVVAPFFFRRKLSAFQEDEDMPGTKTPAIVIPRSCQTTTKGSPIRSSCGVADNFIVMTELRSKVLTFRDLLDLSPCIASASVNELLILTLKDLHKLYPSINSNIDGETIHQALSCFCDALKSIGETWSGNDELTMKFKGDSYSKLDDLEHYGLALLDEMIKLACERMFDMMDEDDNTTRVDSSSSDAFGRALSKSYSFNKSSLSSSPATPTSVLPEVVSKDVPKKSEKASYSAPLLLQLRVQAVGKLNPIDVKRLSFHMLPHVLAQDSKNVVQLPSNEQKSEIEEKKSSDCEMIDSPEISLTNLDNVSEKCWTGASNIQPVSTCMSLDVLSPPSSLPKLRSKVSSNVIEPHIPAPPPPMTSICVKTPPSPPPPPMTSRNILTPPPPPPPPPMTSGNLTFPPPPPPMSSGNVALPPPPPPPPMGSKGMAPPPPPPPMASKGAAPAPPPPMPMGKGAGPPPPPGFAGAKNLRPKKATTKLKRSTQMGNLYRLLKGKVEGSSLDGKSQGRRGKVGASAGGSKQGMADALAEMTKRSAYFIQIEEDVKNHAKTIKDMKAAIVSFQTSDMSELIKFHKYVESHLEKLTDESQVLARFEEFPTKKLEALRMAAAMYSKLDSIASTLQNWPIVSPVGQLLDKAENYFNKIKGEMDTLERTKDDEAKKFTSHKIQFDFGILVRIKELIVDVSSNCMELALTERREANAKENEGRKKGSSSGKLLWKAFQFAFRVYTFAGGHDDRADKLTRELAQLIETDPHP